MTADELRSIPLFADASDAGLERIAAASGEMTAAAGQIVALEGDPGSGMFVIVDGGRVSRPFRGERRDLDPRRHDLNEEREGRHERDCLANARSLCRADVPPLLRPGIGAQTPQGRKASFRHCISDRHGSEDFAR